LDLLNWLVSSGVLRKCHYILDCYWSVFGKYYFVVHCQIVCVNDNKFTVSHVFMVYNLYEIIGIEQGKLLLLLLQINK
jgi:hypothetical protein